MTALAAASAIAGLTLACASGCRSTYEDYYSRVRRAHEAGLYSRQEAEYVLDWADGCYSVWSTGAFLRVWSQLIESSYPIAPHRTVNGVDRTAPWPEEQAGQR